MPPDGSVGFAPADWVLALLTVLLLFAAFLWRPRTQHWFFNLAMKTRTCVALLFILPIAMRLLLLAQHPVPTPEIYDECSHLLLADTLLHGRLANPPHALPQFFETFFVLQQPTYSSIYPLGQALLLAFGRLFTGLPWAGVLIAAGGFCSACYWMLRGWVTPQWALLGGVFAVIEFGPLCQWTNSYWGGSLAATAGCLVFGALPRLREEARARDAVLLGVGFSLHMLTRQFETVFLLLAILLWFVPDFRRKSLLRICLYASAAILPVVILILLQNKAVTNSWTTLPEQLSQYQYGVPSALTIETNPTPHVALTPQQATDYKAQSLTHGPGTDTFDKFILRLEYRVRYYRFFFLPPLYLALFSFLFALRKKNARYVASVLAIFALGTNLFPYLLVHYLAAVTCLFVLASIVGLQEISAFRIRVTDVGIQIVQVLVVLCLGEFLGWYMLHLFETPELYPLLNYETWDALNHKTRQRRAEMQTHLESVGQPVLVFVRYSARHAYQEEWVWNKADIDGSQVVYARDLGAEEDEKLIRYYPNRKVMLLEPDFPTPKLTPF